MQKPNNHLASYSEKMANYRLPYQQTLNTLQHLTTLVQQAWQSSLPESVLTTLMVINHDNTNLTLSTDSHTIANHLNYQRQELLQQLQQFDNTFAYLTQLRFKVVVLEKAKSPNLQCNQNVNNVTSRELSDVTKQNIAHLIELVTDNEPLKSTLQKLIKT
ncbi:MULTISPECIES: DciA family protein [unclassified Moraxella]|uniref:DciA family protein n=1 Tax=unclassified Moraxella TaxID=2685852 RepID=UPI003AF57041